MITDLDNNFMMMKFNHLDPPSNKFWTFPVSYMKENFNVRTTIFTQVLKLFDVKIHPDSVRVRHVCHWIGPKIPETEKRIEEMILLVQCYINATKPKLKFTTKAMKAETQWFTFDDLSDYENKKKITVIHTGKMVKWLISEFEDRMCYSTFDTKDKKRTSMNN
jgi:hypothetical protein